MKINKLIFNLGIISLILLSTGIGYATNTDIQNNSADAYFKTEYASAFESIVQIEDSKSSMTDAQKKLSTDLLKLISENNPDEEQIITELQMDTPAQFSTTNFISRDLDNQIPDDLVYAYIYLDPSSNIENIEPYVWSITDRDANNKIAVAWVEVGNLEKLAGIEDVRNIRTVLPPEVRKGSVTTEGDAIHRTDLVRTIHSYNGTGMKVGVISDGVDSWESARALGDLPNITVLSNTQGGDEGTAMLEIIHDMAPGAELYFHDHGSNTLAFNSGIDALMDAGCDVIVDDISWLLEPFFEDGVIASHVADVIANNDVIYVSSAGNRGYAHYQGNYSSDGTDFHNKSYHLEILPDKEAWIFLQWDDQFGSSNNDYDLYLLNRDNGEILDNSINPQEGNDDPSEYIIYPNPLNSTINATIKIKNCNNSEPRTLELYIYKIGVDQLDSTNLTTADSIFGHPAVPDVVAVGAVDASDPGNDDIEYFSSQGPVTISYPSQVLRPKPDIVGIDGVSITGAGGFHNPFYGTSASAPHVAAIAAQVWSASPDKTASDIREILYSSAIDLGDTGFDHVFGYGRADALNAYNATTNTPLFSDEFPLNGSYINNNNTNVVVNITDGGSGLNLNAFNIMINGSSVVFTNATIDNGYRIENITSQPYPDGIINVSVTAENNFSVSATYLWSFIVDATKPTSTKPEDIEFSANSTENFTYWKLFDLHPAYYWVLLNGTEIISPQQWTNDTNLTIPINTSMGLGDFNYTIQYNDTAGNYGDPDTVMININDTVMININDTSSPYAFGNIPANGSYVNDTPASIYINIADNASGVNKSSISMIVNGTEVDFTNISISKGYNISNTTSMDFAHNQIIDVTVNATDNNSNFMSHSWSFTMDIEDPTIDITSHLDGSSTVSESVIISGIANGTGSPASVTLNDVETAFEGQNGTFTQTTPLSLGINTIYASVTDSAGNINTTSINITRTSPPISKISGGGGGGGGTTGEAYENIQRKEVISQFVSKGDEISYEFEEGENDIDKIRFDALKNSGKISVTVEVLKDRSSKVAKDPEGKVYRHMNIWVGKTGFATEQNIADPVIGFRVNKSWINDSTINDSTIILNRYHDGEWNQLTTTKTGGDEGYLYFEAKTPGFSPFAITGEEKEAPIVKKEPAKLTSSIIEDANSTGNTEASSVNKIGVPTFLSKIALVGGMLILLMGYFKRKYLLRKLKK